MAESLIQLNRPQFENLMKTKGLDQTVDGVLSIANDEIDNGGIPLTRQSLSDGTHPILDKLDRYKNLAPEKRQLGSEEILTIFTNVEDFGKYDPQEGEFTRTKAIFSGAGRMVPEAVGGGLGFKAGLAAAAPFAAMIPPIGLPGLAAKGIVLGIGGIGGAILGAIGAGKVEDAVIGEADPVVPSLEGKYRMGETGMIGLSMLASPWKLAPSIPKASTGALEFLENFKNVSSGKIATVADEGFQLFARNSGLGQKQAAKLFEKASRARAAASQKGKMFGGGLGVNLGIAKFNPAGYLLDPRKGPLGARIIGGLESGIGKSLEAARKNTKTFLGLEGSVAAGSGYAANVMQDIAPYDEKARIGGELLGSLIVPIPVQVLADSGPTAAKAIGRTVKSWWGSDAATKKGFLETGIKKDQARRILTAMERSIEYEDTVNAEGKIVITADEKIAKFIEELGKVAEVPRFGVDGELLQPTVADLASAAGLDFSRTLQTIQNELVKSSEDLKVATGKGREELQAGAVNAIRALTSTGDPLALAYAARIQQGLFEQNIMDGIDGSVSKLVNAASKVVGREIAGGSDRVNLSEKLYGILDNQITLSKIRESELWNQVRSYPLTQFFSRNNREINQPNVLQLLDRPSRNGGLKFAAKGANSTFRGILGGYAEDIDDLRTYFQQGKGRNPANAQRFFEMRSELLNKAAQLRKVGDNTNAKRLDKFNDALLRDLTGQKDGASESYNTARAYTFARNNVFTRSFLSELQATDKNRGLILDPKNLLDRFFRGDHLSTVQRYDQIKAAGRFLVKEGGITEQAAEIMDADATINAAIRDSLGQIMDKAEKPNPAKPGETIQTFVVNPSKLETWKKKPGTKELFALLPELEVDLANAQSAQNTFDNMLSDVANQVNPTKAKQLGFSEEQIDRLYATKAFQSVLEFEDPGKSVATAIASPRPALSMNNLFKMVDEANYADSEFTKEQALGGLKSAIFNSALVKSNNSAGLPNGDVLQKELFGQMKGVDPSKKFSMKDFLVDKKLATAEEMDEVQNAIKTLRGVEEAFNTGNFENVLFKKPSLAKLFYVRIAGATAGGMVQQKLKKLLGLPQMSGGLIAEQTGSELVQRVLLRGPETQRIRIMTEMFSNPKMLAKMMQDITKDKSRDKAMSVLETFVSPLARQVGRRIPIGVRAIEEDVTGEYESPKRIEGAKLSDSDREKTLSRQEKIKALQQKEVMPTVSDASPSISAVRPAPPAQADPQTRQKYAALFPNDPTSAMIKGSQGGIGSLFG